MTEFVSKGGLPFSDEDLEDMLKNEGTLYDWLDADRFDQNPKVEKQTSAGDYDLISR